MARIELTISPNYVPSWKVWEGLRELIANGFDAEIEHGAACKIDWYNNTIRIENTGVTLARESLLLGQTTKPGRSDTIGMWGEGMKLGLLALLRQGLPVKIRSGSEVWVPSIQRSEKFNSDVMVVDIQTGRNEENRVRIEIGGISKESYDLICSRFLRLQTLGEEESIRVPYTGDLLLGDKFKGKVFVKGVFIKEVPEFSYGYNFTSGTLNRDRDILDDLDYRTKEVWTGAASQRPDLLKVFFNMVENSEADLRGLSEYSASYLPDSLKDFAAEQFTGRFGANTIPVASMGESKDAEHFGTRGVVVNKTLLAILGQRLDTFEVVKEKTKDEITARFSWGELAYNERTNLERAATALSDAVGENVLNNVTVAEFRSPELQGLFKGGEIVIAKKMLVDEADTLGVLIHEWSHSAGSDGTKDHVHTIEETWAKVYRSMLGKAK